MRTLLFCLNCQFYFFTRLWGLVMLMSRAWAALPHLKPGNVATGLMNWRLTHFNMKSVCCSSRVLWTKNYILSFLNVFLFQWRPNMLYLTILSWFIKWKLNCLISLSFQTCYRHTAFIIVIISLASSLLLAIIAYISEDIGNRVYQSVFYLTHWKVECVNLKKLKFLWLFSLILFILPFCFQN